MYVQVLAGLARYVPASFLTITILFLSASHPAPFLPRFSLA